MRRSVRWLIVAVIGMVATWLTWWVADQFGARWLDLPSDPGSREAPAAGLAAAAVAIVVAWGAWWAGHDRPVRAQPTGSSTRSRLGSPEDMRQVGKIPTRPPGFLPREKLAQALSDGLGRADMDTLCVLIGPRGVGKTQLAAECVRQHRRGWSLVAWLSGESSDILKSGLAAIAAELGIMTNGDDAETAAARAKRWLENSDSTSVLIVDDAEDPDVVLTWLPSAGRVHTIITTTNAAFRNVGGASVIDVGVFSNFEAVTFLNTRTGRQDDPGAAEIAGELGCLPLALAQAAWVISSREIPYRAYTLRLRWLSRDDLRPVPGEDYPKGAAEAILLSFAAAEQGDGEGITRRLTDLLGLGAFGGIQRRILTNAVMTSCAGSKAQAHLMEAKIDDGFGRLATASIVTLDHSGSVVTAHRLVQRVAQDRALAEATLVPSMRSLAAALYSSLIPPDQAWHQRAFGDHLVEQINALAEVSRRLESQEDRPSSSVDISPLHNDAVIQILGLRLWLVQYLCETAELSRAVSVGQELMRECERILDDEHNVTWLARDLLAFVYERLGWTSNAIELYERSLSDREQTLDADHPEILGSRNNLACSYRAAGLADLAHQLHDRNRVTYEQETGPDSAQTLLSLNNMACAAYSAGNLDEAVTTFERVLAARQRVLGPGHPDTILSRGNLAESYAGEKQWLKAIPLFQQAVSERGTLLGHDHPNTLLSRNNLSCAYYSVGRTRAARRVIASAAHDARVRLGDPDPIVSSIRENSARIRPRASRLRHILWPNSMKPYPSPGNLL